MRRKGKKCLYLRISDGIASHIQTSGFKLCNLERLVGNVSGIWIKCAVH